MRTDIVTRVDKCPIQAKIDRLERRPWWLEFATPIVSALLTAVSLLLFVRG
ncbi:hypothetical protein [Zavarzinella formosa]|uniref:hypothetical protein n=1 Tax=Zavarzinella formosa TaxID=360055 RepID=UPI0002D89E97|nr:hypothetical protein [Zavarzinella formosa]